jgi:mycofactocin precursor peptide peptidase
VPRCLDALTWTELAAGDTLLAVPVGATEQHGPHLPFGTDTEIAVALAHRLASAQPGVLAAPPVVYGASGEHQSFAGTLSIGLDALELLLVELVRSAFHTFARIVLVSSYGGNHEAVERAVGRPRQEERDVFAWSPARVWQGDAHAGCTETSVMLALKRDSVRMEAAEPGNLGALSTLLPLMRRDGVATVSPNGILGDPTGADSDTGHRLLHVASAQLVASVTAWQARDAVWL